MISGKLLSCVCAVAACAPMTSHQRIRETTTEGTARRSEPVHGNSSLTVTPDASGFTIASADELLCREQRVTVVHRTEQRSRTVNKPVTVFEYILGLTLGGAGATAIAAPQFVIDQSGASATTDQVRNAGIISAGLGAVFLTSAVINSFRGGESSRSLPDTERAVPFGEPVACGTAPRAGDAIVLAIRDEKRPLGATDASGNLTVAFDSIPADVFDGDWQTATLTAPALSTPIDLTAARAAVRVREWTALSAAPTLDAARTFRTRFGRDDQLDALMVTLADPTYAPTTAHALEAGDAVAAKAAVDAWSADAPTSAALAATQTEVAELQRRGGPDYLYARFEAAMSANADADAERWLVGFTKAAPNDPRVATAKATLDKARATALAAANAKLTPAERARAERERVAQVAALAKAKRDEQARIAAEAKAKAAEAKAKTAEDKARIAAEAKAKAEEDKARIADEAKAKREEQARIAAEAKAKAEEDKARIADEAKAKREEQARIAAEAKAKAAEDKARIAAERAHTDEEKRAAAEQARAAAAETARVAAEIKAKRAADEKRVADAQRMAAAAVKAKEAELARAKAADAARTKQSAAPAATTPGTLNGLWAVVLGDSVWLVELQADGSGKTALWSRDHIGAVRDVTWRLDRDMLSVTAGASSIRGRSSREGDSLRWLGVRLRRQ